MEATSLRAYLVDDEPLAIERLKRLLTSFESILVAGAATDPAKALEELNSDSIGPVDVLFLDIQMPGMTGFDLLSRLAVQPFVIFTTAYDEYALRAFEVNSIDYLVKPIETAQLARAIKKLDRLGPVSKSDWQQSPDLPNILQELAASLRGQHPDYPRRIAQCSCCHDFAYSIRCGHGQCKRKQSDFWRFIDHQSGSGGRMDTISGQCRQ